MLPLRLCHLAHFFLYKMTEIRPIINAPWHLWPLSLLSFPYRQVRSASDFTRGQEALSIAHALSPVRQEEREYAKSRERTKSKRFSKISHVKVCRVLHRRSRLLAPRSPRFALSLACSDRRESTASALDLLG